MRADDGLEADLLATSRTGGKITKRVEERYIGGKYRRMRERFTRDRSFGTCIEVTVRLCRSLVARLFPRSSVRLREARIELIACDRKVGILECRGCQVG